MSSNIKIKRSETAGNPVVLGAGELAYSALPDSGSNGGDRLYLGSGTETNGNAVNHIVIGGKYFTDMLDHIPGTLTAGSAIIVDSNSKIDTIKVANISITDNTISTSNNNGDLYISPNGTGKVNIKGNYTLPATLGTVNYVLTSDGNGNAVWSPSAGGSYSNAVVAFLNTPTSGNLAGAVTDRVGTGYLVYNTNPVFTTSILANTTTFNLLNTSVTTLNIGGAASTVSLGAATGTTTVNNNLTVVGGISVGSSIIPTANQTYDLGSEFFAFRDLWLSGSTIRLGASTISATAGGVSVTSLQNTVVGSAIAAAGYFTTVDTTGNVVIGGNLTVNGTTTSINSTILSVVDKNIELATTDSPTNASANGAGITVKGATDKTLNWISTYLAWTSSENFDLAYTKAYHINGVNVLDGTTLGTGIVTSSLTSVGIIANGTWNATAITPTYGGTGLTSITSRGIMYGSGSGAIGVTDASTVDGSFLRCDISGNPYFSNVIDGGIY